MVTSLPVYCDSPPCIILAFIPFQYHPPSPCSLFSLLCINSSSLFCIFFILPLLYLISFWIYKTLSYFSPGTSTGPPPSSSPLLMPHHLSLPSSLHHSASHLFLFFAILLAACFFFLLSSLSCHQCFTLSVCLPHKLTLPLA